MNQPFLVLLSLSTAVLVSGTAQTVELYSYTLATPTKVTNVEDGSKLYISSTDSAVHLSKISITTNGQTQTLQTLLNNLDANGYSIGITVNSDLTIATTNTADVTDALNGILFISNAAMAKDPNFLVYSVLDQDKIIDRSTNQDTTLVLLNKRVERAANDPAGKPYYYSRLDNFNQPGDSTFCMYQGIPTERYSDQTYDVAPNLIFRNPVYLYPTGKPDRDIKFFTNIEPIQYTLRAYHIRALGPIKFTVSRVWKDMSTYMTTNETTTGYTMSQKGVEKATVDFTYTPNHDAKFAFMITTDGMQSDLNVTMCDNKNCNIQTFRQATSVATDYFQYDRNDTSLYVNPADTASGFFYLQYLRIEGAVSVPGASSTSTPTTVTTAKTPETTTKFSVVDSSFLSCIIVLISLCLV